MKRKTYLKAAMSGAAVLLALPAVAIAQDGPTLEDTVSSLNTTWVIVAGVLVMFMQAGFALLEVGFSRMKNAGAGVAKILTNFSIAAIAYWAVGFALAFGGAGTIAGTHGFFLDVSPCRREAAQQFPLLGTYNISPAAFLFFQFVFCAVSLAIVWGTTLERIKFGAYVIYAIIFSAVIYPIISHWIFGGGWLQVNVGMQDFAGSTVVHLIGATGALAALLLLGARIGKYGPDGKPRAIPGHSMPLVGLGVLILWLGWFGFNPGSTLGAIGNRFAEVALVTNLAAAAGVIAAVGDDVPAAEDGRHRHGRQRRDRGSGRDHRSVRLRRVLGGPDHRCDRGRDRGVRRPRDREGARRPGRCALGARPGRNLGHALLRDLHLPALAELNGVGDPGLWYSGSFHQLGVQALGIGASFASVFVVSSRVLRDQDTIGLRVSPEEEDAGLDISEHGMYGYPEQFIPQPEYPGPGSPGGSARRTAGSSAPRPPTSA